MNDNNEYKRNPTLVFSYHEKNHELTMAEASLIQTAPIQRDYTIEKNIFSVGKTAGNDVIVHDDYVSNFHFKIEFRQGRFFLKDLQSTNGTILNGQKTLEAELSHGFHDSDWQSQIQLRMSAEIQIARTAQKRQGFSRYDFQRQFDAQDFQFDRILGNVPLPSFHPR
jgi:pSer/pThr/pTyr-binding forkhead associated (FHA) protein